MTSENDAVLNEYYKNHLYEVPAETVIIRENEVNLDMYKILKGSVEVYTGYGTENEVILGILSEGKCFGEFGLLLKKPAIYTVVAYSDLVLCRVTDADLGYFVKENYTSVVQIMKSMANTMMIMQHQINDLSDELDEKDKFNKKIASSNKEMLKRYYF